jgi:MFS family permease
MISMADPPSGKFSQVLTLGVAGVAHAYSHLFILLYATVVLVLGPDLGMTYAELQWLSVPGFVLYGAAALPAGILGDRWSSSGMMAVFFFGLGGASILTGFATSPAGLLVGLTLIGLFSSIYHPVGIAWLVKHSVNRGRALGINGVFGNLGTGGAAILAGVLADLISWRFAFFVPGAIAIATGFAFIYLRRRGLIVEGADDAKVIPPAPARDIRRVFLAMTVTVICVGLIFQSTAVALPKIFSDRLIFISDGAMGAGALVALVYLLAAGSQIIGGELADRYPLRRVYLVAQIFQIPIIFLAFLTFNMGLVALAVLMVALNVGGQPAENALLARYTPLAWRGRIYGLKFVATLGVATIGVAMVPAIHGWTGSLDLLILAIGGFATFAALAAALLPRDRDQALVGRHRATAAGD